MADEQPQNENEEQANAEEDRSAPISRETAETLGKGAAAGAAAGAVVGAAVAAAREARSRGGEESDDAEPDDGAAE